VQPISVIFPIAEDKLPQVFPRFRAGQKLTVEAWNRDETQKLDTGTLATMDNQIDQTTATVRLRADFPNPRELLFPNQFVYVRLLVQEKRGVTLIPTAAVQRTTTNTYVYLVNPDSSVTVRNITEGTTEGDASQITSGLEPGDEIVMTGVDKLNEGTKVNAQVQGWAPRTGPVAEGAMGIGNQGGTTNSPAGGQLGGRTPGATPGVSNGTVGPSGDRPGQQNQPGRSGGQNMKGPGGRSQ
jgi:multidrug efflux system membrane fusion protein